MPVVGSAGWAEGGRRMMGAGVAAGVGEVGSGAVFEGASGSAGVSSGGGVRWGCGVRVAASGAVSEATATGRLGVPPVAKVSCGWAARTGVMKSIHMGRAALAPVSFSPRDSRVS